MDMYASPSSSSSAGYKQGQIGQITSSGSFGSHAFIIKRENFTLTYYTFDNGIINLNRIRDFYVALR